MKSKKALFEFLSEQEAWRGIKQDFNLTNVSNETYGKRSMIYLFNVNTRFNIDRSTMERELKAEGFKVNSQYWPGTQHIEIEDSYFKGHHWDE